ncbi:F-box/LRR-repeat protein 3 [Dorcoceras hygrometricum]|uniref:F-box/LRR-repeat protein 3 n=1 Tax=Dorcoceras hygrometricum TaxID=472368 RepID=A0A2Z7BPF3_9LAMI|nr:F-box/LRR-repeat protein 3 [Dorcoceras hygrometricum]
MDDNSSPFNLLTDDLAFKILHSLTDASDFRSFRSACKNFRRLESLHRTHLRVLRPEFLLTLLSKFPNTTSLDLSACPCVDDAFVIHSLSISSGWTYRISRLNLSRCVGLRSPGLEMLVRCCRSLESVDVSYSCGLGDLEAAALSGAMGLKELNLDKCLNVSDVGLAKIAIGCPKLERLSLKWCFEITDIGVEFLSKKCDELRNLDISFLKVTRESLRWISRMEKLEVLQIVGCGLVDDVGLHYLGKGCPSLQVLDISRCDKLSSSALVSVIESQHQLSQLHASYCFVDLPVLHQFKDLKNLKRLNIGAALVSDFKLKIIGENCLSLAEIGLGKCRGVTDVGIMQLVARCVDLKALDLTCCGDLTDLAILAIASSCRGLACLKLECCNLLSETSLESLGSKCSLLQEIDLTDCSGVNDMGLKYLSKCWNLSSLKLGLCIDVSDKGLQYIALNCKKLRELDLYRCTGVGDDGLVALSNGCKSLKRLILSYCHLVTDRGLGCLGLLDELSDVEMRSLPNVRGSGLRKLASGCLRLAELDLKHCGNIDDSGFWALACYAKNLQQINLSGCGISDAVLCVLLGNLTRLQDAKLVNLRNVSVNGMEMGLRVCGFRVKKLKLVAHIGPLLSPQLGSKLYEQGCRIRWDYTKVEPLIMALCSNH